jgi:serine/threonine protein kinase
MPFSLKNYSPLEPIGTGGTSEIFRATQLSDSKIVVIKKIGAELAEQRTIIQQFDSQAESVQKLTHENIIRVFDHGCENGFYYISMEYVDGIDLERFLAADFFTFDRGLMAVYQALKGLLFAHRHGVAHCDIKPGNILIAKNGTVKLTDFGMANSRSVSQQNERIRMVFATPLYMSPEQAAVIKKQDLEAEVWAETNSMSAGEISPPSAARLNEAFAWDLWSVGVLLYRICTKRLPFSGTTFTDLTNAIITKKETAISPPGYKGPSSISSLVHACLEKDPAKRLSSLQPLLTAIETHLSTLPESDPVKALQRCFAPPLPKPPVQKISVIAPPTVRMAKAPRVIPGWDVLKKVKPAVLAGTGVVLVLSVIIALFLSGNPKDRHATTRPSQRPQTATVRAAPSHDPAPASGSPQPAAPAETTSIAIVTPPETAEPVPLPEKDTEPPRAKTIGKPRQRDLVRKTQEVSAPGESEKTPRAGQKRYGTLLLNVDPPRADVFIDGTLLTGSDLRKGKQLDAGSHTLVIQLAGFESHSQSVTIQAGSRQTMAISLAAEEKGYGLLHIFSYPWSQIYIDRTLMGTAPTPSPLSLMEGPHFLELRRNGYVTHQETIEIIKGQTSRIQVDLENIAADSLKPPAGDSN